MNEEPSSSAADANVTPDTSSSSFPEDRVDSPSHELYDGTRFVHPDADGVCERKVMIQMRRGLVPLLELSPVEVRRFRDAGRISAQDLDSWRAHQLRRDLI
jgi:hypothetical protein